MWLLSAGAFLGSILVPSLSLSVNTQLSSTITRPNCQSARTVVLFVNTSEAWATRLLTVQLTSVGIQLKLDESSFTQADSFK